MLPGDVWHQKSEAAFVHAHHADHFSARRRQGDFGGRADDQLVSFVKLIDGPLKGVEMVIFNAQFLCE